MNIMINGSDYIKHWTSNTVKTALDKLERRKKIKELSR